MLICEHFRFFRMSVLLRFTRITLFCGYPCDLWGNGGSVYPSRTDGAVEQITLYK